MLAEVTKAYTVNIKTVGADDTTVVAASVGESIFANVEVNEEDTSKVTITRKADGADVALDMNNVATYLTITYGEGTFSDVLAVSEVSTDDGTQTIYVSNGEGTYTTITVTYENAQ